MEEYRQERRAGKGRGKRAWRNEPAPGMRHCPRCDTTKPVEGFYPDKVYGRDSTCIACRKVKREREYEADPEYFREAAHRWYERNRAHVADYNRRTRERYRADNAARESLRRAWKLERGGELVHPLVVLERHDGVCGICGVDVDPFAFEVDHIFPLARGGEHTYENTQPAHPSCNRRKWARLPD